MEIVDTTNADALREYEDFVEGHIKGHFMQSYKWSKVKGNWLWQAVVHRNSENNIIGSMALLIRKIPVVGYTLIYSPRGPVYDIGDDSTLSELMAGAKEIARKHRAYALKIDPDILKDNQDFRQEITKLGFKLLRETKNFESAQPRTVFRLNIENKTKDEIMAAFHNKTRYNIRLAVRKEVQVSVCGKDALDDFHRIMMETGLRDGFVIRSKSYFENMLDKLGDNARLYMAKWQDRYIAGTLAVQYGDKTWYLYGASSNQDRNVMPNYLLQWNMLEWAVENKCRIYDFRGVSADLDESNPLYGLYTFKKGFSGDFTEFVGEFDYVFKPIIYILIEKGQRLFRHTRKVLFLLKNRSNKNK